MASSGVGCPLRLIGRRARWPGWPMVIDPGGCATWLRHEALAAAVPVAALPMDLLQLVLMGSVPELQRCLQQYLQREFPRLLRCARLKAAVGSLASRQITR